VCCGCEADGARADDGHRETLEIGHEDGPARGSSPPTRSNSASRSLRNTRSARSACSRRQPTWRLRGLLLWVHALVRTGSWVLRKLSNEPSQGRRGARGLDAAIRRGPA
jgi:hypothetical protein